MRLHQWLTVSEFLEFTARAYGVPEESVAAKARAVAMNLGLAGQLGEEIGKLSWGEERKVYVAAGFLGGPSGPRVVFLDEPTQGMDPPSRLMLGQFLRRYVCPDGHRSDRLVVVSSHELAEFSGVADHAVLLHGGRVLASGPLGDLTAGSEAGLVYELTLFDDRAEALAAELGADFQLKCDVSGGRTVRFSCGCDPDLIHRIVRSISRTDGGYRLRELRERHPWLERLFIERLGDSEVG
jgi:ABC-2 type transport system ATP-binding protein